MCRLIAIIISILKWLGIILLVILGVILAVLACLLFVPVRYHVVVEHAETWYVRGRASWLLHLLHFSMKIQDGKEKHTLRILGIPCSRSERKPKRKREKEKKRIDTHSSSEGSETNDSETEIFTMEENVQEAKKGWHRIKKWFQRIREFFLHIQHILVKIYKWVKAVWKYIWEGPPEKQKSSQLSGIREILLDSNTKRLWWLVWESLVKLWRHSQPRKLKGRIRFGTADPCTTGQLLGVIGVGYSLIGRDVLIIPDFEQKVLEGDLEIKGRIQIFVLLLIAKRILWSQEWKHFKKQTEQMKEGS